MLSLCTSDEGSGGDENINDGFYMDDGLETIDEEVEDENINEDENKNEDEDDNNNDEFKDLMNDDPSQTPPPSQTHKSGKIAISNRNKKIKKEDNNNGGGGYFIMSQSLTHQLVEHYWYERANQGWFYDEPEVGDIYSSDKNGLMVCLSDMEMISMFIFIYIYIL